MTNPDNVGGLPELPEDSLKVRRGSCESVYYTPEQMYEMYHTGWNDSLAELCRAAPAGVKPCSGYVCPGCGRCYECNQRDCTPGVVNDSAPAGSGEVPDGLRRIIHELRTYSPPADPYNGAHIHGVWARELEALLRKLQQGADGWRPIESAPKDGSRVLAFAGARPFIARHGRTFGWWDDNDAMRDPTHWQPLPKAPTSQGQDGGA